jgi:hypothetical protein
MAYKVKCTLVAFLGDVNIFPCHFGYQLGDEFSYDGEKFIGRVCPALLSANMIQTINNVRYYGKTLPNNFPWTYSGISKMDPSMQQYDGIGWANVKEAPQNVRKELVAISGLNMPPARIQGTASFYCGDPRTLATFRAEPCGLSDKGFDLPFFRRQMSILDKIKAEPGISAKEILDKFTQWEREAIYPRLGSAVVELMIEELQGADYIELREGKAYPK